MARTVEIPHDPESVQAKPGEHSLTFLAFSSEDRRLGKTGVSCVQDPFFTEAKTAGSITSACVVSLVRLGTSWWQIAGGAGSPQVLAVKVSPNVASWSRMCLGGYSGDEVR